MQKILRSIGLLVLLAAAFLSINHKSWLSRKIFVSIDIKLSEPSICQVFYTETEEEGLNFKKERSMPVGRHGTHVEFSLPISRMERLRVDFGTKPGKIRVDHVVIHGAETSVLDWRDFVILHDIGRFDVDANGAVNVQAIGGDPYAVCSKPLGITGKRHVNWFSLACLVSAAMLLWWLLAGPHGVLWNETPARRESACSMRFLFLAGFLVAARFALVARIPAFFGPSPWDDGWFVNAAAALLRGEWLGRYDMYTLCKGCMGPMVMAFSTLLGVPFLVAETGLYVFGCVFFVCILANLVRNRLFLIAVFAFLLFNPASFSFMAWQRVYRNGMPLWQVPVVFGCLLWFFLHARGTCSGIVRRSLFSGVALWAFANTREDAIWIAPFAMVAVALTAVRAWKSGKGKGEKAARALACLVPIAVVLAGNATLCAINWRVYGMPIRNDRDSGNYAKAMRDLYLIAPDPNEEARLSEPEHDGHYHNIFYSTLCMAYDESPTLRSARQQIDEAIDDTARVDSYSERDLKLDHMLFALRLGVFRAGHYASLPESESFFGNVHRELEDAFREGRLRQRGLSVTAMSAPFRFAMVPRIASEWFRAILFVGKFWGTESVAASPDRPGFRRFAFPHMIPVFGEAAGETLPRKDSLDVAQRAVDRSNRISRIYSAFMPWLLIVALSGYVLLSWSFAARRLHAQEMVDWWLFATGMLGSILVHTACIGYVTATTFGATSFHYLAASYQLALMFAAVIVGLYLEAFRHMKRKSVDERE